MSSGQSASGKRTPLFEEYQRHGAKVVDFAGWDLPVQFSGGIINEHNAVRTRAGVFDVSHMGEIFVSGADAERLLQHLTCNDLSKVRDGGAQYNALINPAGGVVDDIIVYRFGPRDFLVCVNAANRETDARWITDHNSFDAEVRDESQDWGQIAVQGPRAVALVSALPGGAELAHLEPFHFARAAVCGVDLIAARTGYTGEDGMELFIPAPKTAAVWRALFDLDPELTACGLGARDSLRLEACYPLHGHELGTEISAIESGLGWIVKPDKGDFIGRDVLARQKESGAPRALVCFILDDPGIARHGDQVADASGNIVGVVTSGTKTPTINRAIGMALIRAEFKKSGGEGMQILVRGRALKAHMVPKPFYKRR